jgi:hypothetical protein
MTTGIMVAHRSIVVDLMVLPTNPLIAGAIVSEEELYFGGRERPSGPQRVDNFPEPPVLRLARLTNAELGAEFSSQSGVVMARKKLPKRGQLQKGGQFREFHILSISLKSQSWTRGMMGALYPIRGVMSRPKHNIL